MHTGDVVGVAGVVVVVAARGGRPVVLRRDGVASHPQCV
jgi:hypothetical protein